MKYPFLIEFEVHSNFKLTTHQKINIHKAAKHAAEMEAQRLLKTLQAASEQPTAACEQPTEPDA